MRNRILLILLALFSVCQISVAQGRFKVTGTVKDNTGEPLIGAAVVDVSNRKNGVVTNEKGEYSITIDRNATVEVSFLTFKTIIEPINGRNKIDFSLTPDNVMLDATVVIGYGTSKKGDLTGSVSTVEMSEIADVPVASVAQSLEGKIAGAEFASGSGEVGETGTIRIRGSRSISAGNEPLIVVDGVADAVSDLGELNPSDIVNISVLKDVSSTAIYGSRGANGVILVTTQDTKRPEGKFGVKFKTGLGVSHIAGSMDLMNATEYAQWRNMCAHNLHSSTDPYPDPESYGTGTDWVKELSQVAFYQNYHLSLNGNVGKTSYTVSVGYNNTPGVVLGSGMKKLTANMSLNSKISKKFTFNLNASYTNTNRDRANCTITGVNASAAIYLSPMLKVDDVWNRFGSGDEYGGLPFDSPYLKAKYITNKAINNFFLVSPSLKYDINAHLYAQVRFSGRGLFSETGYYSPSYMAVAKANDTGGTAKRGNGKDLNFLEEITLNYKRKMRDHEIDGVLGFTAEQRSVNTQNYSGTGYTNDALTYYNIGSYMHASAFTPTSSYKEVNKMSVLGRLNYNWKRRYYFTLTARADGSSNFAENKKWGFFPAGAFRWSIMNEEWFNRSTWLNDLSLRLSAGRSGNDAINPYMSLATLTSGASSWIFGDEKLLYYAAEKLQNSNLTWETTDSYNVGINFSAWSGRVNLEVDGYLSNTRDLLLAVRNTQTTGFNTYYSNGGATRNVGVELTLTTKNIVSKNFTWTSTLTISHNNQVVTAVDSESEVVPTYTNPRASTQYMYGYKEGYPVNALWGYQYAGVWHNTGEIERNELTHAYVSQTKPGTNGSGCGQPKYVDVNHDGLLDQNDVVYLGSADPVVYGGFQNTFKLWKRLTIGLYLTYSVGGYIYNLADLYAGSGSSSYNKFRYMLNAWTEDLNTDTDVVKAGYDDFQASSKSVYDASYFRIKNLSISYDIPFSKKAKKYIKGLVIGINCDNLYLWKKYPGFDPDVNTSSSVYRLDNGSYPRPRTYAFNLQLKF